MEDRRLVLAGGSGPVEPGLEIAQLCDDGVMTTTCEHNSMAMPRSIPELLATANTRAKLETALRFGADAVYLGLRRFSMRSFAGNSHLRDAEVGPRMRA